MPSCPASSPACTHSLGGLVPATTPGELDKLCAVSVFGFLGDCLFPLSYFKDLAGNQVGI